MLCAYIGIGGTKCFRYDFKDLEKNLFWENKLKKDEHGVVLESYKLPEDHIDLK